MVFRGPGVGAVCRQPLLSASQEVFSRGLAQPSCHPFWLVQEPEHHPWPPASLRLGSQCKLGDLQTHCWGQRTGGGRVEASGESLGPPSWDTDPAVQQLWLLGNRPSWPSAEGGQEVRRVSCWSVFSLPLSPEDREHRTNAYHGRPSPGGQESCTDVWPGGKPSRS